MKIGISVTALQWFKSYLSGPSGCFWGVRFLSHNFLYWGSSGLSAWTTSLLHLHVIIRISHSETWLFLLCRWHSTLLLIPARWSNGDCSHCSLSDRHFWMDAGPSSSTKDHQILAKTELLMVSANPQPRHNFSIQLDSSTITPSRTARDDQLSFTDHIATTAWSCRFAFYNIRKIKPFLSEQATQLLAQALVLSRLDHCNALLEDLLACIIKTLQLIENLAARVVFNKPINKDHVTSLFISLHWLPIATCIKFKVLMFARILHSVSE